MFCPSCGTESLPNQKFCMSCGATLHAAGAAPTPPPYATPQTKAEYPPTSAPAQYVLPPAPFQYAPPPMPTGYPPPPPGHAAYPPMAQPAPKSPAVRNVAILVVLAAVSYGAYYYFQNGKKVTIGTKDQVIYSGQATKDQATALGNALKVADYFQDRGVTVLLSKGSNGTVISYVVLDGVWDKPDMVSDFETLTRGVASTVGGLPINIQLMNLTQTVEKEEVVTAQADASSTVMIGTEDQVRYSGTATKDQATALGNRLKTDGYFQDRGVTVLLSKGSNGTVISYVVKDGVWNNPTMVSDFEVITRDVAAAVGGLPVDMQLMNSAETVEKYEIVNALPATAPAPQAPN